MPEIGQRVYKGTNVGEIVGIGPGDLVTVLLYMPSAVITCAVYSLRLGATPDEAEALEREARSKRGRGNARYSGFRFGTPQCDACRRILKGYNQACPNCGGYSRPRDGARGGS